MTLKNARIYQELLRRLSPSEEAVLRPCSRREDASSLRRPIHRVYGGLLPMREFAETRRAWNRQG